MQCIRHHAQRRLTTKAMYPGGSNLNWTTHGLLHMPNPAWWWSQSHAQCPVPDSQAISPGLYRIYYSTRDSAGKSRIGSCLLNTQLMQIVQSQSEPELDLEPSALSMTQVSCLQQSLHIIIRSIFFILAGWSGSLFRIRML